MATRGASRWDGDVHYYDYTPDTLRREPNRDAYVVAEAFVYDTRKTEKVAITVLVSGQELEIDRVPRDEAIRRGEAVREQAVAKHRAQLPAQHRTLVYDLTGREIVVEDEAR